MEPNESRTLSEMIKDLQDRGTPEDIIEKLVDAELAKQLDQTVDDPNSLTLTITKDALAAYDPKRAFKEDAPRPKNFDRRTPANEFTPVFALASKQVFVLNGEEKRVRILNTKDMIRLTTRLRGWLNYIGYNVPEMLVDEVTGKYRVTETLMKLLERTFSDWDEDLDRPTDFTYSVLTELCSLLEIPDRDGHTAEDYLLSCDPNEVLAAVQKLIECNQDFFIKLWNSSGPIKENFSLMIGLVSSYTNPLKENLKQLKSLMANKAQDS